MIIENHQYGSLLGSLELMDEADAFNILIQAVKHPALVTSKVDFPFDADKAVAAFRKAKLSIPNTMRLLRILAHRRDVVAKLLEKETRKTVFLKVANDHELILSLSPEMLVYILKQHVPATEEPMVGWAVASYFKHHGMVLSPEQLKAVRQYHDWVADGATWYYLQQGLSVAEIIRLVHEPLSYAGDVQSLVTAHSTQEDVRECFELILKAGYAEHEAQSKVRGLAAHVGGTCQGTLLEVPGALSISEKLYVSDAVEDSLQRAIGLGEIRRMSDWIQHPYLAYVPLRYVQPLIADLEVDVECWGVEKFDKLLEVNGLNGISHLPGSVTHDLVSPWILKMVKADYSLFLRLMREGWVGSEVPMVSFNPTQKAVELVAAGLEEELAYVLTLLEQTPLTPADAQLLVETVSNNAAFNSIRCKLLPRFYPGTLQELKFFIIQEQRYDLVQVLTCSFEGMKQDLPYYWEQVDEDGKRFLLETFLPAADALYLPAPHGAVDMIAEDSSFWSGGVQWMFLRWVADLSHNPEVSPEVVARYLSVAVGMSNEPIPVFKRLSLVSGRVHWGLFPGEVANQLFHPCSEQSLKHVFEAVCGDMVLLEQFHKLSLLPENKDYPTLELLAMVTAP